MQTEAPPSEKRYARYLYAAFVNPSPYIIVTQPRKVFIEVRRNLEQIELGQRADTAGELVY